MSGGPLNFIFIGSRGNLMGWNEVSEKHKRIYDKLHVGCEETYERTFIKKIVKKEFPSLSESAIETAMANCYKAISKPCPRNKFFSSMKKNLGVG